MSSLKVVRDSDGGEEIYNVFLDNRQIATAQCLRGSMYGGAAVIVRNAKVKDHSIIGSARFNDARISTAEVSKSVAGIVLDSEIFPQYLGDGQISDLLEHLD